MAKNTNIPVPPLIKKDKVALKIWNETASELKTGITKLDAAVMTNYCFAYARALRLEYFLKHEGMTVAAGKNGFVQQRPEVAMQHQVWKEVQTAADRLGLSPLARKKLTTDFEDDDGEDFDDL